MQRYTDIEKGNYHIFICNNMENLEIFRMKSLNMRKYPNQELGKYMEYYTAIISNNVDLY